MKNLALFAVALLVGVHSAQATSLHPDTFAATRLSFTYGPVYDLHHLPVGVHTQSSIVVRSNGNVLYTRKGNPLTAHPGQVVAKLSASQMRRIERLIGEASEGEIKHPEVFCAAVPTERRNYHADDYQVILASGAEPCGMTQYNDSEAAEKLIQTLDNLRMQAESLHGEITN